MVYGAIRFAMDVASALVIILIVHLLPHPRWEIPILDALVLYGKYSEQGL
jgi:hypothetical protein